MSYQLIDGRFRAESDAGLPLSGGRLYTYSAGTTTQKTAYVDAALTTPNTYTSDGVGGLYIALNSRGEASVFFGSGAYSISLYTAAGVLIWTQTYGLGDADMLSQPSGADKIGYSISDPVTPTPGSLAYKLRVTDRSLVDFGGVPSGSDADIAANNAAWAAAQSFLNAGRRHLQIEPGQFNYSGIWYLPMTCYQNTIEGAGPGETILQQTDTVNGGFQVQTGSTIHSFKLKGMMLRGAGYASGTGHGFFVPGSLAQDAFALTLEDLWLENFPERGVFIKNMFTSTLMNVQTDNTGSHGFDIPGGNTNLLINCYPHKMRGSGTAGFRIHGGAPVMINCNGIDMGDYWGIFGNLPAEGDDSLAYCQALLIGCNVEDFAVCGIRNKTAGITLMRTNIIAPATGTVTALLINPTNSPGTLDNANTFVTKGAAWANSLPVHTSDTGAPFTSVQSFTSGQFSWYNEAVPTTQVMSTDQNSPILSNRYAYAPQDLYIRGLMRTAYNGSVVLSGGTATITFGTALPAGSSYSIKLGGNANETFRWGSKTVAGFTITSSNAGSTATVDWSVELVA